MKKRICFLLCIAMVLSLIPISGFAADISEVILPYVQIEATVGQPCTLTVPEIPGDDGTLTYQWKDKNLSPIEGANESSYTFTLTSPSQSSFVCEISDGVSFCYYDVSIKQKTGLRFVGKNESNFSETINVQPGESITLNVPAVSNNDSENFPITYAWSFKGNDIVNSSASYTIPSITPETHGIYSVVITSGDDTLIYQAYLQVPSTIELLHPDTTYYYNPGDTVTLDATATSSHGEVSYKWIKGYGVPTPDTIVISTAATLTLQDARPGNVSDYRCIITDNYNTKDISFTILQDQVLTCETNIPSSGVFTVLPGDTLTFSGTVTLSKVEEGLPPEEPVYFLLQKYVDTESAPQEDWWYGDPGVSDDYCPYTLEKQVIPQGDNFIVHFTYQLDGSHPEINAGKYRLQILSSREILLTFNVDYKDYQIIAKESNSGVKVEGLLHPDAKLIISTVDNTVFQSAIAKGDDIIWSGDISLATQGVSTSYDGVLTLSIPVGEEYNGRALTILHIVDGQIETIKGTVENGVLRFNVASLSPFAVVDKVQEANNGAPSLPQTGDSSLALPLLGIAILALTTGLLLNKRRQ